MIKNKVYFEMRKMDKKIENLSKKKLKNFKEHYHICPNCGELSTFSEQLEACSNGGMPYCYCKFNEGRIFVGYKRVNKKLWEVLKSCKTDKLRLKKYLEHKIKRRKD